MDCPRCENQVRESDRHTIGHGESDARYTCPVCGVWTRRRDETDSVGKWYLPIQEYRPCADCGQTAETEWEDGTPLCFGCAYGRAGWESGEEPLPF